jgi:DNA-binding MarR family transcriptional regulator
MSPEPSKQQAVHAAGEVYAEKNGSEGATAQEIATKLKADRAATEKAIQEAHDEGWIERDSRYPVFFVVTVEGQTIIDSALFN